MVIGIQIIGLAFTLFMVYLFFIHYKKNELSGREFASWIIFWCVFAVVTLHPPILDPLLGTLNFTRALDFFAVIGILFLVFVTIHNYLTVKRTNKRVEILVRNLALKKSK